MTQLIVELKSKADADSSALLREYVEILRRADSPQKNDPKRLDSIRKSLGLSLSDVEADLNAAQKVAALEKQIVPPETLAALNDVVVRTAQTLTDLKARHFTQLRTAEGDFWSARAESEAAIRTNGNCTLETFKLKRSRPRVFPTAQ